MTRAVGAGVAAMLFALLAGCSAEEQKATGAAAFPVAAGGETARCYGRGGLKQVRSLFEPRLEREILVLIDQTTTFPEDVRQAVVEEVARLVQGGAKITVGTFSSYTESEHAKIVYEAAIEPDFPVSARDDAPMRALRELDGCLTDRAGAEAERLRLATAAAVSRSLPAMQRSDILANVKTFGRQLGASRAPERIFLLVSDMLENSSRISFYSAGSLRRLEPETELAKVEQAGLLADIAGARVFVTGAGLLPPDAQSYRTVEEVEALAEFWRRYFEKAGAASVEIGTPRLHAPIG